MPSVQTYSHFLMTALARDRFKANKVKVSSAGMLLGSFMPDVPLIILTLGYFAYRRWIDPLGPGEFIFGPRYDNLYFGDPYWITGHALFHGPLLISLYLLIGFYGMQKGKRWGLFLFWFAAACGLHSAVDILTHHNDGPLLLFPFNWTLRFSSPVSYWDPQHYGRIFASIEHLLDLGILAFFGGRWLLARARGPAVTPNRAE